MCESDTNATGQPTPAPTNAEPPPWRMRFRRRSKASSTFSSRPATNIRNCGGACAGWPKPTDQLVALTEEPARNGGSDPSARQHLLRTNPAAPKLSRANSASQSLRRTKNKVRSVPDVGRFSFPCAQPHPQGADLRGQASQFRGAAFLGAGVLVIHGGAQRSRCPAVYPRASKGRPASRSVGTARRRAAAWSGSEINPPWAVHNLQASGSAGGG